MYSKQRKEEEVRITLIFIQQDKHIGVGGEVSTKQHNDKCEAVRQGVRRVGEK